MSEAQFEFKEYLGQVSGLRFELLDALKTADDEKINVLVSDVPEPVAGEDNGAALTVAFVGQYNAGKSTIISALTGKQDIPIDADVCTDTVTAYDWAGISLLDTPGIYAGYAAHDDLTYRTIDRADLLVFVITSELFEPMIGDHFRDLAFERDKAREILLVVNKMGMDPGTPNVKLPGIAKVTQPLSPEDFKTVFIDAKTYLDALEEADAEDRAELFAIAGFEYFVTMLNTYVRDHGFMGRLTTPLFGIRSLARQAGALLTADMPEERAAIELLNRKRQLFFSSRVRLKETLRGLLSAASADITTYGDEVAESIAPEGTEESVQAEHQRARKRAEERCAKLEQEVKATVEAELQGLKQGLEMLHEGTLAKQLREGVEATLVRDQSVTEKAAKPKIEWARSSGATPSDRLARLKKVGNIAQSLGTYAAKWTAGPFAQAAKIGSATAARGSQAHHVIYNVGKFFGAKFKPWGAVNVARHIGNVGRIIGIVGSILAVLAQLKEEQQQEEQRRQLRDERDSVRRAYRAASREIEAEFWASYEAFSSDFYDGELEALEASLNDLVGQRQARTETAGRLNQVASEAQALIRHIQTTTAATDEAGASV